MSKSYSRHGSSHLGERGKRIKKQPLNEEQLAELRLLNAENEMIQSLRDYYRANFKNGHSNESFILWLETKFAEGQVK